MKNLYLIKISFKTEDEIKMSDKQKLSEIITVLCRAILQEIVKKVPQLKKTDRNLGIWKDKNGE